MVYIGDDRTDEDAFRVLDGRTVTIRVPADSFRDRLPTSIPENDQKRKGRTAHHPRRFEPDSGVDLSAGTVEIYTFPDRDRRLYLEGKGLSLKLLYDRMSPAPIPSGRAT